MRSRPVINLLRPECTAGNYTPCQGDYPARLVTRRTLGLDASAILGARENSPRWISCADYVRPPS